MLPLKHLDLHLTHKCNLRCSYCYAGVDQPSLPPDISPELADAAVDFLVSHSDAVSESHLTLWGGEPFVRRDLIERVAARVMAKRQVTGKRISIHLSTNGTLLDAAARRLIKQYNLQVSLSLDGSPDGQQDRLTPSGESSWPIVETHLGELFAENDGPVPPVRMTVSPQRAGRLAEDISYLLNRGFRLISFLPVSGVRWTDRAAQQLEQQLQRVAEGMVSWIREGQPFPPYYPHLLRRLTALWIHEHTGVFPRRAGNCGAGSSLVAVDTRGDIYPCHRFVTRAQPPSELRLGHVSSGITHRTLSDRMAALSLDQEGIRCADCPTRDRCVGLCVALNYKETGDISTVPDQACFVNLALARCAERIHQALLHESRYKDYLEPFLHADPDERSLLWLAVLAANQEQILDQLSAKLCTPGEEDDEEP